MAKITINDLDPQAPAQLTESQLSHVLAGIKDGTSNTLMLSETHTRTTQVDGADFLAWQRGFGTR